MGGPVNLEERPVAGGKRLAVATLDAPATLNSLSLPMLEILAPAFARWAEDPAIVGAVLRGAGGRAFCAGGDVQALYTSMKRNAEAGRTVDGYAETFFEHEYRLDYQLHRFPKPLIALGHGIVMGGGLGLFSASRFRVVTEASRIAMPEVTIGLFPDAGATWILRGLVPQVALYLGVTGSHMNAADALHIALATHAIASVSLEDAEAALVALDWHGDQDDAARVDRALKAFELVPLPESPLRMLESELVARLPARATNAAEAADAVAALGGRHAWLDRGIGTLKKGCPTSVGIVVEQIARARTLSLVDTFRLEMILATHCARRGEFAEGVRALLIDKDNTPRWHHANASTLPRAVVDAHFEAPWAAHPLADLG